MLINTTLRRFIIYRYLICCLCLVTFVSSSEAAKKHLKHSATCSTQTIAGDFVPCKKSPPTSLVIDAKTGKILHAEQAHASIYPASLTKIMTLYVVFEALKHKKLSMNQTIHISTKAANMPPGKLWLKAGDRISVRDAVMGAIVKSANDAAVALAEAVADGSEARFATLMTKRAKQLGMSNTQFRNASGWHHPDQKTTAYDLAKLAVAMKRDFPEYYKLFSETQFIFRGKPIHGHNHVTANYQWADGLKTGFHNPAGACIVTTASRNNKELVGVVTGSSTGRQRDAKVISLLDKYFGVITPIVTQSKSTKTANVKRTNLKKKYHVVHNRQRKQRAV